MRNRKFICGMLIVLLLLNGCSSFKSKNTIISSKNITKKGNLVLQLESSHFIFYSKEQDKGCINDLSKELEDNYVRVTNDLNTSLDKKISIYIFSDLKTYHEEIYQPNAPNWVVGNANPPDLIQMVNPSKVDGLSYSEFKKVIVHEFTHIVTAKINPGIDYIPLWLSEGTAMYEAKQDEGVSKVISKSKLDNKIPKLEDLETDSVNFANVGGYQFSYSIVGYIVKTYGYDKLIALIRSPLEFEKILGISKDNFQKKWIASIN